MTENFTVDGSLPIAAHQAEIAGLILTNQVVIVAGETGSGKSTQLPKICLSLGRRHIGHTQPRRIAARTVAARIASEIGTPLSQTVGYQVRFTAHTSSATRLKVMTDGIMLAEISHDRLLRRYDTIIIDEAHERSLNIDFLLGYLKQLLPRRPDLKVIITSATIDTARFSAHFDNAPIVEVSGRTYPVEVRYRPLADGDEMDGVVAAIRELPRQGDILIFFSGEREIKDAARAINGANLGVEILPLFARLSMQEQSRVFAPHGGQRVVLATNVAETSLTVPGIRYVVDPGLARISRYSARTKVQRLPIEPVSQASANQRAGRCGRVAPGICIRLYSEEDFLTRPQFTEPEILRTNLASVILAMANAHLGDIAEFPFVEAPNGAHIADGVRLLRELGAISAEGDIHLTDMGRKLANLPIDPRLGRILLEGAKQACLREVIVLVAGLSIQDVRERPVEHREEADALHMRFAQPLDTWMDQTPTHTSIQQAPSQSVPGGPGAGPARITPHTGWKARPQHKADQAETSGDPGGDFAAMLRLWVYLRTKRKDLGSSQFRKMCVREYVNYLRVREWQDLVTQLRQICKDLKLAMNPEQADMESILTACLSGLLTNIGALDPLQGAQKPRRGPREYIGTRGARFAISPGSVLAKSPPDLVMAVELTETTRLWAHTVAQVTPHQVEMVGSHLVKRSYSEPFFSPTSGTVLVHEKVSLLGVPLIADRRVGYAAINPTEARAIFIEAGLVEGMLRPKRGTPYERVRNHNLTVREMAESLEDKTRRRGLVKSDQEIAEVFASRLPARVVSGPTLDRWLREDNRHAEALMLTQDDLLASDGTDMGDYPEVFTIGPAQLGLDYHFAPGEARDGVTVTVPLSKLASLDPAPFTWGVPGTRPELATELIRSLPKRVRTQFVPAPDFARKALKWLADNGEDHTRPITDELTRALKALTGVTATGWNPDALPAHLRMGFVVRSGKKEQYGKDLATLQASLGHEVKQKLMTSNPRPGVSGTTWVFGAIPESVTISDSGVEATGYPALSDEKTTVTETLQPLAGEARTIHHGGLTRLSLFALPEPYKWVVAHMTNQDKLTLAASPYPKVPDLLADAWYAAVSGLIADHDPWKVRDGAAFEELVVAVRPDQVERTHEIVLIAAETVRTLGNVESLLARLPATSDAVKDVEKQCHALVYNGFLRETPPQWLDRIPVYMKAAQVRLESAVTNPLRDQTRMAELRGVLDAYDQFAETHSSQKDEVQRIGYLIEELRIQIFAQQMRTRETVSAKRLMKAMADTV